jgi:hypothetical protein
MALVQGLKTATEKDVRVLVQVVKLRLLTAPKVMGQGLVSGAGERKGTARSRVRQRRGFMVVISNQWSVVSGQESGVRITASAGRSGGRWEG